MVENFLLEYDKESSYALAKLIDAEHMPYDMCDWIDTLDVDHTDFGNARVVNVREITDDIDLESNEWCPAD